MPFPRNWYPVFTGSCASYVRNWRIKQQWCRKEARLKGFGGIWRLKNRISLRQKNPSSLTNARRKGVELRHGHPFAYLVFYRRPASEQKGPQVIWEHGQGRPDNRSGRCFGRDTFYSQEKPIPLCFTATVAKIEGLANFEIAPLDLDVLKIAESIEAPLEMHDKLIVATAIRYDAFLITRDEQITKSKAVKTIW